MRRLSSLGWRSLWARPLRSLLTVIGIALGVGVLFASLAAASAMDQAVERAADADFGRATLRVSAVEERGLLPATVQTIVSTSGVKTAAPALIRRTYLASTDRTGAEANLPAPVTVLGIDPGPELAMHDLALAEGTELAAGLERSALVSETLLREDGVALGDEITVNGSAESGPQPFRVVGVLQGDGPLAGAKGRIVVIPLGAAQSLFGAQGVTRVDLLADEGISPDRLMGQLQERLTTQPYMLDQQADVANSLRLATGDFRAILLLVAALVLFVGAFLIFNTLSMTVTETSREVGLLRAAGTTRRQVLDLILLQAIALAIAGSVAGVALGAALSYFVTGWLHSAGALVLDTPGISLPSVLLAIAVGVLVTLAAALEPAWRASRISPVEALRIRRDGSSATFARLRWLVVVFAALALAAIVVWPAAADQVAGTAGAPAPQAISNIPILSDAAGSLLVYGLLLACVLVFPFIQRPIIAVAGLPLRVFRSQERLARSSLARDPSRTALTAGALVVGLAMVVALATAADNVRRAGASWLAETIPGDQIATSIRPIPRSEPVNDELAAIPGVQSVSPIALFGVPLDEGSDGPVRQDAAAVSGRSMLDDGRLSFVEGDRRAALDAIDTGGAVILPRSVADRIHVHPGDTLSFTTGPEPTRLRVAAVVAHSIPGSSGETILVGWSDAEKLFGVVGADMFAIRFAGNAGSGARAEVDRVAREYALEPADLDRVGGSLGDALERVFRLLDALAIAAVLVAGLGVVNTLSMSVLERVREIGVLRAAGMTGRQVWGMVVVEAALLGIAGALVGCVAGVGVGIVLTAPSAAGFGLTPQLPWATMAVAFCFGVIVSIAAAIYPARAASRISIVRALQYE